MNIGSLFRGMMGDNKPGEAKQMELKEGQVVRGVVTSVSEDGQEAVVQIQGVKVRAKLEAPLQQGETTLLQVQPPGKDGMTVLKPVTASQTPIPPSTMNDLLDSFQLPDTKDNREMLTQMRAAGIALTADNVKTIQSSMAQKPANVSVGEWVQSAAVALQRGLPVTGQSVAGLQQAIFGPPLHESLDNLQNLIRSILPQLESGTPGSSAQTQTLANEAKAPATMLQVQGQSGTATGTAALTDGADPKSSPTPAANANSQQTAMNGSASGANATNTAPAAGNTTAAIVGKLQQVLQQLNNLIPQAGGMPVSAPGTGGQQAAGMTTSTPGLASDEQVSTNANATTGSTAASSTSTAATSSGSASPWLGQLLKLMGAEYEQQSVRAALTLTAQNSDTAKGQGTALGANAQAQQSTTAQAGNERAAATLAQPTAPTPPTVPTAPIVPNVAQPLPANAASLPNTPVAPAPNAPALANGATSNQTQAASNDGTTSPNAATANTASTLLSPQAGNERTGTLPNPSHLFAPHTAAAEEALNKAQDTLKGLLLQLSAADDVPPALKDAAQQLVQQLTGQQLLLNTDRTAPFAQVTMFVPFNGPEGQETASVHIQSRRGSKGELDASNCRLWFDLDMKALGHTLLDVQVVDRIVSLKVHNDLEQLGPVIENKRQEVAEAISGLGYQLLSLNFAPLPVRSTADHLIGNAGNVGELIDQFAPTEYKGVDMKI